MEYRSVSDLKADAREMAEDLQGDVDLVVAIPRSGLLAAELLCLYLEVPMTDVAGLCRGECFETGNRHVDSMSMEEVDTALVLDDSVYSGSQMTETRERLAEKEFPFDLEYGAVYITYNGHEYVDRWHEVVGTPRVFEWNVVHHYNLDDFCVDVDGVLCRDPTEAEDVDQENYREFVRTAEPKVVPNRRVGWLVTARPEKYRAETEAWLDEHGVTYDNLVMMDHPGVEARRAAGDHAEYKAEVYEETGADLFIASGGREAVEICERTNRPVYCYETSEMVQPDRLGEFYRMTADYLSLFREQPLQFSVDASEQVVDRVANRIQR